MSSGAGSKSLGAVRSRINTGRNDQRGGTEVFTGYQSKAAASTRRSNVIDDKPRKMSFKQRRDMVKEQTAGKSNSNLQKTQENVDSLSRRSAGKESTLQRTQAKMGGQSSGISNLRDTRNRTKT